LKKPNIGEAGLPLHRGAFRAAPGAAIGGWTSSVFDQFHSSNFGSKGNRMRYENKQVDQIPQIPIYSTNRVVVYNKRVKDYRVHSQQAWYVTTPSSNVWIMK
jgi:hypothetical protein